jgi:alpha-mannosidase
VDRRSEAAWRDHGPAEMVSLAMKCFAQRAGLRVASAILCVLAMGCFCSGMCAQEKTIWEIGKFDASSAEFRSQGIDYSKKESDPVYRVGKSKDREDWLRFQPGPANGLAGGRAHPFTILFTLPEPQVGVYRLTVGILYETPRLSHLQLEINGHAGNFYFHPHLDYAAGDWEGTFVPQTSTDTKVIEIPAKWLRAGENRFVLTALDTPSSVENSLGDIALGHTGLIYDALKLTQSESENYSGARVSASVVPTIFFRAEQAELAEVVEAFVSFPLMPASGELTLLAGGKRITQSFTSSNHFGELRAEFNVPEWNGEESATLSIKAANVAEDFPVSLQAQKKWTVFIVPQEHLDVGFTDYPDKIAELHSQAVDGVLEVFKKRPEFRWTLDGSWVAEQYLAGRSPEKQREFLKSIRDGKITLPMQYANQHTGVASLEGLVRSLYPSAALAKRYALPIGAAHITDVPSYSWSYASVLHDAGVKYFAAASNSWRAPILLLGRWNEKSPFYWEGPDGGRVLMWYSRAYLQLSSMFGTPQRIEAVKDALPVFLQAYGRPEYTADATILFGSQLENTALNVEQADLVHNWQAIYTFPRLEYSSFAEAMSRIESQFHGKIPVFRGDFGPYWEDGFASGSFYTATHRQNQQRILTAEKFGAATSALDPVVRPNEMLLDSAWKNSMLFDEHTWTFVGATTQPDNLQTTGQMNQKGSETTAASEAITRSIHRSWAQLEYLLGPKEASIVVFNSVNWPRSGFVEVDVAEGSTLFDVTNDREVLAETISVGRSTALPGFGGGYRRVRFLAEDVPGLGYKLFAIRPVKSAAETVETLSAVAGDRVFESPFYRLTVDAERGSIRSLWDKELKRELVDEKSPYGFGAYVYVRGADDMPNNSLYRYGASLKPPVLTPVAASGGKFSSSRHTPYGTVITLTASAPETPLIRTEITLLDKEKRIELRYTVQKKSVLSKEAVYIAFPFAVQNPVFRYETQNGWVNPAKDELLGGSREWYAAGHWASVSGDGVSAAIIPRDAPLVTFGDIVHGNWPGNFEAKTSSIFSWLMSNYWGTNFAPQQGGEFTFRYDVLSASAFDAAQLTRTGWNTMTPLEADQAYGAFFPGALPASQGKILEIDNPNVALSTWKRSEDGQGTILRLVEFSGKEQTVRIRSPYLKIGEAWNCSLLEEKESSVDVSNSAINLTLHPFEIKTVRLQTTSLLALPADHSANSRSEK